MTAKLSETIIQAGSTESAQRFNPDCVDGDWNTWHITFPHPFPHDAVHVIVAPSSQFVDEPSFTVSAVGVAHDINKNGFTLQARNASHLQGGASLNWMAVQETPGSKTRYPVDIRLGAVQPKDFAEYDDEQNWRVVFSSPIEQPVTALVSASNLCVEPFKNNGDLVYHNCASLGIVGKTTDSGFHLLARNSDCGEGSCNFYYCAVSPKAKGLDLYVDTGSGVGPIQFLFDPDCKGSRDWHGWDVTFKTPFLTPPVVLVSTREPWPDAGVALVGIARNVTPWGFRLAARNSDCAAGNAGFDWVAFGCELGCA